MKIILDIDQDTLKNIQGYCSQNNIPIGELVSNLFNKYIQEPATIIDDLYEETNSLDDLNEFAEMLTHYLNEAIYDIEVSAKSEEAYKTDLPMSHVFKTLNRDIIKEFYVLTQLYKTYKDVTNNE